jgi:8-oxo-dGTP pyrophosphatase MutT (NUDIX family)
MKQATPFAVFAVAPTGDGLIAATTRAHDRGEAGRIGLPGGKVDQGETPIEAVIRESAEEGWTLHHVYPEPIHTAVVDGHMVWWFAAATATKLSTYKEVGRITPLTATLEQLANSGYGNDFLAEV